jgi:hypothetical protein
MAMSNPSFLLLSEERRGVPVKRQRLGAAGSCDADRP